MAWIVFRTSYWLSATRDLWARLRAVAHVMEVMTENRVRHLPVIEEGRLAGIVTIGDVVNAFRRVAEDENTYLKQYIQS